MTQADTMTLRELWQENRRRRKAGLPELLRSSTLRTRELSQANAAEYQSHLARLHNDPDYASRHWTQYMADVQASYDRTNYRGD